MTPRAIFRILLVSAIVLLIIKVIASYTLQTTLPIELQEYLVSSEVSDMNTTAVFEIIALILAIILSLILTVGLWFFKPWVKTLYILMTIVMFPIYFIDGAMVLTPWERFFGDISLLLEGAIIALMFTGPVGEEFLKK